VTGLLPPDGVPYNVDQWDGYTADRRELFAHLADNGVQDTVFLTGDIHSTWACDLPLDAGTYPASRSVGVELVGTSVTSDNLDDVLRVPPRTASVAVEEGIKGVNRHVRHLEFDSHGFSVLDVTPERVQMDWYYLDERTSRSSGARPATSYKVEAGTQRRSRLSRGHPVTLNRRTFLRLAGGSGLAAATAGLTTTGANGATSAAAPGGSGPLRVYVLVVDGARPDEVTSGLMPRLADLGARGTNYPAARSLPVMETIPNHVMMATGVRPDRSGVPANSVVTGTVLSKRYLHGIFSGQATHEWEPAPLVPVSGHAPDAATVQALVDMVDAHDSALVLVNLGDVDRVGHSDETGGLSVAAARKAALASTDLQVGRFLDHLRATGRWNSSVVMVLADHSMDWSLPQRVVSLTPAFAADALLAGRLVVAQNGGADLCYWTGPDGERAAAVQRMRSIAATVDGVLRTHEPGDLRLGPEAGDVVVYCRSGWRFTEPTPVSNPIPGNHGRPVTEPIPFFVGGGSRMVRRGTSSAQARTVDIAPTVAALFGLPAPVGGFDGTARTDAFTTVAART